MSGSKNFRPLRLLTRAQQATLSLLRHRRYAPECAVTGGQPARAFDRLVRCWTNHGLTLIAPNSNFVAEDEYLLLAALALGQSNGQILSTESDLARALDACGAALVSAQIVLPLTQPMLQLLISRDWIDQDALHEPAGGCAVQSNVAGDSNRPVRSGPRRLVNLRAQAIALAKGRSAVTADEFRSIGVSRPYLNIICARGFLERVSYNWYRLPGSPDTSSGRTVSRAKSE